MDSKLTAINPNEDDAIRFCEFTPCVPAIKSFIYEAVSKTTVLGILRAGGARNVHVLQLALRLLRSGVTQPAFARNVLETISQHANLDAAPWPVPRKDDRNLLRRPPLGLQNLP